jgi:hypothetical protein
LFVVVPVDNEDDGDYDEEEYDDADGFQEAVAGK